VRGWDFNDGFHSYKGLLIKINETRQGSIARKLGLIEKLSDYDVCRKNPRYHPSRGW